jgi:short-subunit dehydrogenase
MEFQGRTAWVTGASSGIGEALAGLLSARGAAVILSGRRVEALQAVAGRLPGEHLVLPFEATDLEALPRIVERALAWRGGVDLLINNAGITQRSLAVDTDFQVYRRIMEIDYFAPVRLTQLVLPHMIERGSGHLSVISSIAGKIGVPLRTAYCSAKHAVVGYFDALRAECEQAYGVTVSVVTPGAVATPVARNALKGDGSAYAIDDPMIDAGMPVAQAAQIIVDGIAAGQKDIPVGNAGELAFLARRFAEPEAIYAAVAAQGARLAEARTAAKAG